MITILFCLFFKRKGERRKQSVIYVLIVLSEKFIDIVSAKRLFRW